MTFFPEAKIITFEGLDGSGKSTQLRKLSDHLGTSVPHVRVREPGNTALGGLLRRVLKDPRSVYRAFNGVFEGHPDFELLDIAQERSPLAELFLFLAARAEFITNVIQPHLQENVSLLIDRCLDSTVAYQGGGLYSHRPDVLGLIDAAHDFMFSTVGKPALTLLFDIDYDTMVARLSASGAQPDFIEQRGRAYFERVREGYLRIAKREPHRVKVIDGKQPEEHIFREKVLPLVEKLYEA